MLKVPWIAHKRALYQRLKVTHRHWTRARFSRALKDLDGCEEELAEAGSDMDKMQEVLDKMARLQKVRAPGVGCRVPGLCFGF